MGKKLYEETPQGGIKFTSHRMGQVRVANYVYDIWLPVLGATSVAVYSVYCRLERTGVVKSITQADIAKACRIGTNKLAATNKQLEECGFIKITRPQGHQRLMHWTTEVEVFDPPEEVSGEIIEKYQHPQGYQALSTWLVADVDSPEIPNGTSGNTKQYDDEIPNGTPNVVSLVLNPLEVEHVASDTLTENPPEQPSPEQTGDELLDSYGLGLTERKPTAKTKPALEVMAEPYAQWGSESQEFQRQLQRFGVRGRLVQDLGWNLEQKFGMRPDWDAPKEVKSWSSGLGICLRKANDDLKLIYDVSREMRTEGLAIANPYSMHKMIDDAMNKKRSGMRENNTVFGVCQV